MFTENKQIPDFCSIDEITLMKGKKKNRKKECVLLKSMLGFIITLSGSPETGIRELSGHYKELRYINQLNVVHERFLYLA